MTKPTVRGERIEKLRSQLGLSQSDVATRLKKEYGVNASQSHLSKMEKNGVQPSLEVLYGLVVILETSADYLLGLTDDPKPVGDLADQIVIGIKNDTERQRIQALIDCVLAMAPREQEMILHLWRRIANTEPKTGTEESDEVNYIMRALPQADRLKIVTLARDVHEAARLEEKVNRSEIARLITIIRDTLGIDVALVIEKRFNIGVDDI